MHIHTVVVRADVQTSSLGTCNCLRNAKQRRAQGLDALLLEDLSSIERRTRAGDLNAETVAADPRALKLGGV